MMKFGTSIHIVIALLFSNTSLTFASDFESIHHSLAVFSISTDNEYLATCLTALQLLRHQNQRHSDYMGYFIGGNFSASSVQRILDAGITPIVMNLNDFVFTIEWPPEAFWWHIVPEFLCDQGWTHSLYIDGDIVSLRELNVSEIFDIFEANPLGMMAGVSDIWPHFNRVGTGIGTTSDKQYPNVNSGVLAFHNQRMKDNNFSQRFLAAHRHSIQNNLNLLADQGLVNYMARQPIDSDYYLSMLFLSPRWQVNCEQHRYAHYKDNAAYHKANPPYMFHFTRGGEHCRSKPGDDIQPPFYDALHETAWYTWNNFTRDQLQVKRTLKYVIRLPVDRDRANLYKDPLIYTLWFYDDRSVADVVHTFCEDVDVMHHYDSIKAAVESQITQLLLVESSVRHNNSSHSNHSNHRNTTTNTTSNSSSSSSNSDSSLGIHRSKHSNGMTCVVMASDTNTAIHTQQQLKQHQQLPQNFKMAVFSISTDNEYLATCLTALQLLRYQNQRHSDYMGYFIGGNFSASSVRRILDVGITPILMDPNDFNFTVRWPPEAFWWHSVPGFLCDHGWTHSLYIDGDIVSLRELNVSEIFDIFEANPLGMMAGVSDIWPHFNRTDIGLAAHIIEQYPNVNTGVLAFHNERMKDNNLSQLFLAAYRHSVMHYLNLPCADQGLVNYMARQPIDSGYYLPMLSLSPGWQVNCEQHRYTHYKDNAAYHKANPPYMFHFTRGGDYCRSKPGDDIQPPFYDALHETAWYTWNNFTRDQLQVKRTLKYVIRLPVDRDRANLYKDPLIYTLWFYDDRSVADVVHVFCENLEVVHHYDSIKVAVESQINNLLIT